MKTGIHIESGIEKIILETLEDLFSYSHNVLNGLLKESINIAMTKFTKKMNGESFNPVKIENGNVLYKTLNMLHGEDNMTGMSYAVEGSRLIASHESNMMNLIIEGHTILINKDNYLSYFSTNNKSTYNITCDKQEYTGDDINITRYNLGNHYYAKITFIDVVIDGNVKWNTHEEAKRNALIFLKELNNEENNKTNKQAV